MSHVSRMQVTGVLMPDDHYEKQEPPRSSEIEGKYVNCFQVGHNAFEFLLDFGQSYRNGEVEHFHTRIVTTPPYAKELLRVLKESIEQYERAFGPIHR